MSDALSNIGQFFNSNGGKALEGGAVAGTGLVQNIMANRQAEQKQKFVQDLITNPAKFSSYVQSFEKPLAQGLTSDISRQTDAYGAERGLGSSPAIMKDVYAQALAPYIQQQQQQAQQAALQGLGIYENSPTQKPMDVSSILKAIMMQPGGGGGGGGVTGAMPTGMGNVDLSSLGLLSGALPSPIIGGGGGAGFDPTTMEGD